MLVVGLWARWRSCASTRAPTWATPPVGPVTFLSGHYGPKEKERPQVPRHPANTPPVSKTPFRKRVEMSLSFASVIAAGFVRPSALSAHTAARAHIAALVPLEERSWKTVTVAPGRKTLDKSGGEFSRESEMISASNQRTAFLTSACFPLHSLSGRPQKAGGAAQPNRGVF